MSAICPNCKARLSCGCQRRTASNGAAVCTRCITSYEAMLKSRKVVQPQQTKSEFAPTDVKVVYHPPKQA